MIAAGEPSGTPLRTIESIMARLLNSIKQLL